MAAPKAKKRAPRKIKDAGQRVVFAGLELDTDQIAKLLAESMRRPVAPGATPPDAQAQKAELAKVSELLSAEDGKVTVWVQVGETVEGGGEHGISKPEAVARVVDEAMGTETPGRYRAPTMTAWRGEERRRPPAQVALEVEVVD